MANINEIPKVEVAKLEVAEEAARPVTNDERRHYSEAQRRYFEALEARNLPGAPTLITKTSLMDTTEWQAKNPDLHARWVNTGNKDKAEQRQAEGYVTVPEEEGGRRLGEMVLMAIPRRVAEARRAAYNRLTQDRLGSFNRDMKDAAAEVREQLRRRGINVARDLMINE